MPRKIKRDTRLYRKTKVNKKALNTFLFILLILVLVCGGFVLSMGWQARVDDDTDTSSDTKTSLPSDTSDVSSTPPADVSDVVSDQPVISGTYHSVFMPYTVYEEQSSAAVKQWLDKAKTDGYDTVTVELKDETGIIHYKSTNLMAEEYQAVSKNAVNAAELVKLIKEAGLIPHASLSAMKDKTAPSVARENSYAYGDDVAVNWWDNSAANGGKPWLNPYMANTRQYIADLSKEVSDAGFMHIVLTNVMFPDKNTEKMNVITESMSREDILKQVILDAQGQCEVPVVYGYTPVLSDTVKQDMSLIDGLYEGKIPFIKASELNAFQPILAELEIDDYVIVK